MKPEIPAVGNEKKKLNRRTFVKGLAALAFCSTLDVSCTKDQISETKNKKEEIVFANKELAQVYRQVKEVVIEYGQTRDLKSAQEKLNNLSVHVIVDLNGLTANKAEEVRYIAYFALGMLYDDELTRTEVQLFLENGLEDKEIKIQMMSALSLLSKGDKKAIPVLIKGLDDKYKDVIMFSHPPRALPDYAWQGLCYFTEQNFGRDKGQWQNWWETNLTNFSWDEQNQKIIINDNNRK